MREISDPVEYEFAIDHICESLGWDLCSNAHRRKAHFRLEWAVREEKITCALLVPGSTRPYKAIRTFSGGVGWLDLANSGGRPQDTIYDAHELRETFPLRDEHAEDVPSDDVAVTMGSTGPKGVRQPAKMWMKVALEVGIHLQRGGDPSGINGFVNELLKERGWVADKSVVSRHVSELIKYGSEHKLI